MSAAALNTFHNVLLRSMTGENTLSITVNNHPLPLVNVSEEVQHVNIIFMTQSLYSY